MRDGLLARDPAFETRLREAAIAAMDERERAGDPLGAWRIARRLQADSRGVAGAPDLASRLARLERDPRLAEARRREIEEERQEADLIARATVALARAFEDPAATRLPALARELGIPALRRRAASAEPDAAAARRLLATLYVQTSFYLPRRMVTTRRLDAAELSFLVALEIEPEGARAWYGLAAVRARAGRARAALDALESAVAAGFDDPDRLAGDEAFVALRGDARFVALLDRLRAGAGLPPGR